jgi:hypothetical protein
MIDIDTLLRKPETTTTTSQLTKVDLWDHFLARVGYKRGEHRVKPGIYSNGNPTPESPVFVSANYTLSFDALRSALHGINCYILVLDTQGINVWCAAGKGTFGTNEIVTRVLSTRLKEIVTHRRLILPQLAAPGVAAHEVKRLTGFLVEYGPVRASDLPEYLQNHQATPEMRRVRFPIRDRVVLIPVEIVQTILPALLIALVLYFIAGWSAALMVIAILIAGTTLFPILLPWIPTTNFSTKGCILGGITALPFAIFVFLQHPNWNWYRQAAQALGFLLVMSSAISYISLNFTGSSTYTSRSGVQREIFTYIPLMAWSLGLGVLSFIVSIFVH